MQRPSALSSLSPQNFSLKKFLTFFLKKSTLKKIIIFSQKKAFFIFQEMELSKKRLFFYFGKMELLYFGKWNFLAPSLKNFRRELSELKI